jgi:hypothetical protein
LGLESEEWCRPISLAPLLSAKTIIAFHTAAILVPIINLKDFKAGFFMVIAGITAYFLAVDAENKPLEQISQFTSERYMD